MGSHCRHAEVLYQKEHSPTRTGANYGVYLFDPLRTSCWQRFQRRVGRTSPPGSGHARIVRRLDAVAAGQSLGAPHRLPPGATHRHRAVRPGCRTQRHRPGQQCPATQFRPPGPPGRTLPRPGDDSRPCATCPRQHDAVRADRGSTDPTASAWPNELGIGRAGRRWSVSSTNRW